jgi:hypothetical protein
MNPPNKRAGQSTRQMADKRHKLALRAALLMIAAALLILVATASSSLIGIGAVFVLVVLGALLLDKFEADGYRIVKRERQAVRGAVAEERIGSLLDGLGEDYLALHDIESPYGNIDHVVLDRLSCVFLIETKSHRGRVTIQNGEILVNGHQPEKDFISQALKNTYWLRDQIRDAIGMEVWITPVVVFTNAFVERSAPVKNVTVINERYLQMVLRRPNAGAQQLPVWENRARISETLCEK